MHTTVRILAFAALAVAIGFAGVVTARAADQTLLNISCDPTPRHTTILVLDREG